ncbi:transformer-2 protein homolog alpha isoform X3 [Phlebotomus papatasi]|uniref:transformer-2 protein homolog alpha isoform X3 n=1 Tax=Phlebotomus papatasi TaxID=29031 RepID=UPI0024834975|nr:transformer-2 protein homolog alpha isoform X3 [Phlebotomus papatasi]
MTSDQKNSMSRSPSEERHYISRAGSSRENGDYRKSRKSSSRSRARYRSRSRSRSRSEKRYRSRSPSRHDRKRSYSRSPNSSRRRHVASRNQVNSQDHPPKSRCLGVFGLSDATTEDQIYQIFSKFGTIHRTQIIMDAMTGCSRGFCFVYFANADDAKVAKDNCSGMELDGRRIRVDYSITQRPHTPTPGVYMGQPTGRGRENRDRSRRNDDYYERERGSRYSDRRSPYRRRRHRSRSRSYSPRIRRNR